MHVAIVGVTCISTTYQVTSLHVASHARAPSSWYGGTNVVGPAPSEVVVVPSLLRNHADAISIGRPTIATQNGSMYHGVLGTVQGTAPAMAGQYADVIYKGVTQLSERGDEADNRGS